MKVFLRVLQAVFLALKKGVEESLDFLIVLIMGLIAIIVGLKIVYDEEG
jgi:hypothetical protein